MKQNKYYELLNVVQPLGYVVILYYAVEAGARAEKYTNKISLPAGRPRPVQKCRKFFFRFAWAGRRIRVTKVSVDARRKGAPLRCIRVTSLGTYTEFPSLPHDRPGTRTVNSWNTK